MNKDYYKILGIDRNATQDQIKKAYRKMAKKYHPDVYKGEDKDERFKEINEANSVLSDPDKKRMYDTYGTADEREIHQNNPFGFDFGFNPFGFGQRTSHKQKERGDDLRITINVKFDDLFYGVHKKIRLTKDVKCHRCHGSGSETNETTTCPHCNGSGYVTHTKHMGNAIYQTTSSCEHCNGTGTIIKDPCPCCDGTGVETKQVDVEFDIPAGIQDGGYFVVEGAGNEGPHRGIPGSLIVMINETPSETGLTRDNNNNLLFKRLVPFKTLVFGGDIEVPYINNTKKTINIKAGTNSGKTLRIRRAGFPDPNDNAIKSDYYITIECDIPNVFDLTEEQQEKIKKWQ